jgi:hypothetical protein
MTNVKEKAKKMPLEAVQRCSITHWLAKEEQNGATSHSRQKLANH